MRFFTGIHQPTDVNHFDAAFVSVNRLKTRKAPFVAHDWIMDSGAFTEISTHGKYRQGVKEYAEEIKRWKNNGNLLAAVSQDYMCESFILEKTGLTVQIHQELTVKRYDDLIGENTGVYILPVLQGFAPMDYVNHLKMYGDRLKPNQWVGVGSICKRNGNPAAILQVLAHIKTVRPDLRLHGFGLKKTALSDLRIRQMLHTADSMAWSYSARKQGRSSNDWREAKRWTESLLDKFVNI